MIESAENRLRAALARADTVDGITVSVVVAEMLRKNEACGLSEPEMEYWADRIIRTCNNCEGWR